ncbi:MAG: hypothetical protein N2Z63_03340 [Thiobacillaceae bacterium]|nr:hypothetical protein [Thiobacillaceae bacterium]MDW8324153.1 hypothetical protein [Burkholderiales bacterium]
MPTKTKLALIAVLMVLALPAVRAEPPMTVDDAGVMERGGLKIEAAWVRDHKARGPDIALGYGLRDDLELALNASFGHDHALTPSTHMRAFGMSAKWLPWVQQTGWSAGVSVNLGHARVHERATQHRHSERNLTFMGLATFVTPPGHKLHLNLGREHLRTPNVRDQITVWGLGCELAFTPAMQLTLEYLGADTGRPDRAMGLRLALFEGFKVSTALGRGGGRSFGQVGFAWEF